MKDTKLWEREHDYRADQLREFVRPCCNWKVTLLNKKSCCRKLINCARLALPSSV